MCGAGMNDALVIGAIFGAIVGLVHGRYVYADRAGRDTARPIVARGKAVYFALWTFALWVLFGSYVLYFGLLSTVIYAVFHAARWIRSVRRSRT